MRRRIIRDFAFTIVLMLASFFACLFLHENFSADALIPSVFMLSVFLISMLTTGYFFGILSALLSVLAVNYAFTFPYFEFNFTMPENIISIIIVIIVTLLTSTLTTKLKNHEKIKMQADREQMRANLLRAVSHDLRTPLTVIFGSSSTIIENYTSLSDELKLEMLEGIMKDSQWLIRMVENLLSVTRIDGSSIRLIKSSVVLEELVDSVLSKFKKSYPGQEVEISLPEDFITVSADAILIEQVLINLLENAVQHAHGMTELKLNVFVTDENVVFEVMDNGCGIAKERLKDIFSGYLSSEKLPADSHKQSMGIGLSVCSAIIKAHGGEITAKNNSKGKGMLFRFTLGLEEEDDE